MASAGEPGRDTGDGPAISTLSHTKVCILTYGCTYNFGDSRKLEDVLASQGCRIVATPEDADAVVINTCTVIAPTERKMLRVLHQHREKQLYVTGCMPEVQRDEILRVCSPVFISQGEIMARYRTIRPGTAIRRDTGIVQIARGCQGACTYCITRRARGQLVSNSIDTILQEIRWCHERGATEIQLCAQDCSAWGTDYGGQLGDLLAHIADLPGTFLLRIGMMNPGTLLPALDAVIESFSDPRLFRFVHIPVQSGSDRILSRMGRGYTREDFLMIVREFREHIPDITLATDIITGFPGEDEQDVRQSVELLSAVMPAKVNVTRYSRRPGTAVSQQRDHTDQVKKVRSRMIQQHAEKIYQRLHEPILGTTVQVTVTERLRPGSVLARTGNYTGVVVSGDLPVGMVLEARITTDRTYFFLGDPVS